MICKRIAMMSIALVTTLSLVAGCGGGAKSGKVVIGSKDFTENIILGEMIAQLIEQNTDIKVERKLNLGGTKVNFDGLKSGNLDLYVDYDGTAWGAHLGHTEPVHDPATLFDAANKELSDQFKIKFTRPFGFNNTYALAVPEKVAEQYSIKTYSDLAKHAGELVFGTTSEFLGREADGFNPLSKVYGFKFKDVKSMTAGLRYRAVEQGDIQVMDAYATDGNLKAFDMQLLQDDKHFFPPYNGAPLVRLETLEQNKGLEELLNKLGGTMTDEVMQELNYRVAVKNESEAKVSTEFLKSKGLIK
jgi:osmoprotectant transport system substrate-binding protein